MTATYMPAISLYMNASVTLNVGPDFKYPISFIPKQFNKIHKLLDKKLKENQKISLLIPDRLIPNPVDEDLSKQLPDYKA